MAQRRGQELSVTESARLLDDYERSGLSRRDYCRQTRIPVSTLDYYRRRQSKQPIRPLVPVTVLQPTSHTGFTLVLTNGRRIEGNWDFLDQDLARLVWIAEQS